MDCQSVLDPGSLWKFYNVDPGRKSLSASALKVGCPPHAVGEDAVQLVINHGQGVILRYRYIYVYIYIYIYISAHIYIYIYM